MAIKKPLSKLNQKRGLGKPLHELLGKSSNPLSFQPEEKYKDGELIFIQLDKLQANPHQPRQSFKEFELESLVESIKNQGVLQPILVKKNADKKFEIIAGERRFRAAKLAGLETLPCIVKLVNAEKASAIALIENIQRQDLNPIDEAMALERLIKIYKLTHLQLAENLGKPRSVITNQLRILQLSTEVKDLLKNEQLEMGHAKVLLSIKGPMQIKLAKAAASNEWSVRALEIKIQQLTNKIDSVTMPLIDPNIQSLQNELADKLGAQVLFAHQTKGRGKLIIKYNDLEELEGILAHIH